VKLTKTYGGTATAAAAQIAAIEQRGAASTAKVEEVVAGILADVRKHGYDAVVKYATTFDQLAKGAALTVSREEMQTAWETTTPELRAAMEVAQANIRQFAELQRAQEWSFESDENPGLRTGQVVRPLGSVGCYVPGGRYPLPSTLLMTVTPAQVAGVTRIVVCSPKPAKETLAAAYLAGVTEFYRVGGAQAIAAMAFGAGTIGRVEKIVGPGNLFVTAAKVMVSHECGIDMPAGPTEIGICSETGDAAGIAADLVAQAEHDPEALAVLVTSNEALGRAVLAEVKLQAKQNVTAKDSLARNGAVFVTETVQEARHLTNRLAFEHLSVDAASDVGWVQDAGSIFVGRFSPQSMGDYVSGPNHVLPTGRAGRVRGGLSVNDFLKVITVQQYTKKGLHALGPHAIALAEAEGLVGHAESVRVKLGRRSV
jgi:histidinol dehydrogenase